MVSSRVESFERKSRAIRNRRQVFTFPSGSSSPPSTTTKHPVKKRKTRNPPTSKARVAVSGGQNKKGKTEKPKNQAAVVHKKKGDEPGEEYYQVERIIGFRISKVKQEKESKGSSRRQKKGLLMRVQWVSGEVTWEPLWCLDQLCFEEAKVLVLQALEKQPNEVDPDLIHIASEVFDIDVLNTVGAS